MSNRQVEVEGTVYELAPEPVRTSLSDGPPMLWGFQVFIRDSEGKELGMKTCFVGRVSVQFRNKEALEGGMEDLVPVLHDLAFEKIIERLKAGETADEILFV